ncbi:hypothetical protein GJ496_001240 [Pomphorhynchus laevis]|nr:hypothetical protein GJ496_001240 [Pomphorhynchus laevis]
MADDYDILSGIANKVSFIHLKSEGIRIATIGYSLQLASSSFYNYLLLGLAYILSGEDSVQLLVCCIRLLLGISLLSCSVLICYAALQDSVQIIFAAIALTFLQAVATVIFAVIHLKLSVVNRIIEGYEIMTMVVKLATDVFGIIILIHLIWSKQNRLIKESKDSDGVYFIRASRV